MERRLGRGLGSLLTQASGSGEPAEGASSEIEIARIQPNPYQPRTVFDDTGLDELAASIRNHGILQPVALRRKGDGFELISGERRWRAARMAGLERVPATVREDVSDRDMLELALVENVQRVDLNPMERAVGFQRVMEALELTQEATADKVGLRRSTVTNHLRLLDLPDEVQAMVAEGLLSMGHARAILGLADAQERVELAERAVREGLSVRDVEQRVRSAKPVPRAAKKPQAAPVTIAPWAAEMQNRMRERLGTKVSVENGADYRGRIVIEYFGREELERVYSVLAPREEV